MRLWNYVSLAALLGGVLLYSVQAQERSSPAPAGTTFAFWYDTWQPDNTLKKLQPANVILGVPPSAIPEIHKSGKRALQYVTYYQSRFGTAFLKDRDDLSNVGFMSASGIAKSAFGGQDNYVLCPDSVELKGRVLRYVDGSLKQGFDGYFVDNTFFDPPAHEACSAAHQHVKPGIQGGRAYVDLLAAVREKLKQQNPSAILVSNPGSLAWADRITSGTPSLWDVSDYVVWESYGYTSLLGPKHDAWKAAVDISFNFAASPEKARKILALSYPRNIAESRFAFAVAKVFGFQWTGNLGEKQQDKNEEGGHFGAFFDEIPLTIGEATSPLSDRANPVLHRLFARGEIFANTSTTAQSISISRSGTLFLSGEPGRKAPSRLVLPGMSSAIVVRE
jgi:hypothetical protein